MTATPTTTRAGTDTDVAETVVLLTFFGVGEDVVGFLNFGEALVGVFGFVDVGVPFPGELTIGFLECVGFDVA